MKTVNYLDAICDRYNVSDFKAATLIGVTRASVSRWRTGKGCADESTAKRFAELLEIEPEGVLIDIRTEHAKDSEIKKIWQSIAAKIKKSDICYLRALFERVGRYTSPTVFTLPNSICR